MSNGEGGLRAPVREIVAWQEDDYWNKEKLDEETRRQFDVCHGCRRCFNLCDSFPKLFDLIDESETYELDSVKSEDFKPIIDACTMCDMCFMVTCPYVPPHEFSIDITKLMLRHRAKNFKDGKLFFENDLPKSKIGSTCSGRRTPPWVCRSSRDLCFRNSPSLNNFQIFYKIMCDFVIKS